MENTSETTYNISQAAKMFKVATSLIRYWESEFEILNPKKDEKGNRIYTEKDIANLRIVYHLVKEKGFTLLGAKKALSDQQSEIEETVEILHSLKTVKKSLLEIRNQL
ncbi:MAG: MerR family transcriptional regulator [Cyclobacteriaceae bacterium]|nr:MerR family transcriptional regulator [Cyclobacteriaceae bacterium]